MLGICCDGTYGAMMNYDNEDENGDNNGDKDGNGNNNATNGSGYDGMIFDPITTLWSLGGVPGNNGYKPKAHYVSMRQTIYLPYNNHIKDLS